MWKCLVIMSIFAIGGCDISGIDKVLQGDQPAEKPAEATSAFAAYAVSANQSECRDLVVPAWLKFTITNKQPGTAEREEVVSWGVTSGHDWHGGNPAAGTFSYRAHDSRPTWAKLKVYGTDGYAGEPAMHIGWDPAQSYALEFSVDKGSVTWSSKRLSDGVSAVSRISATTPDKVRICYGDPVSRYAAIGAKITEVSWSSGR